MADSKISALPASTTPLDGTEVLPIVQSGVTKQVSIANLTAGRSVGSAGGTFTDNYTQGTAAKGVNFVANTPLAGMTGQLLNAYEEGTWVPSNNYVTLTSNATARYVKIGTLVYASFDVTFPSTANGNIAEIRGIPYYSGPGASQSGMITWSNYGSQLYIRNDYGNVAQLYNNSGATVTNNVLGTIRVAGVLIYNTNPL